MQFFTLAAAAAATLASLASAVPTGSGSATVTLTFKGAADGQYVLTVPVNGKKVAIANPLSVTSISAQGPSEVACSSHGVDGAFTYVPDNAGDVPVGPPQTQDYVSCSFLPK